MAIDLYEVVKKLNGEIEPIGETRTDEHNFENLKNLCKLVDKLLFDINRVIPNSERIESSMKHAGLYAKNFMQEVRESV